METNLKKVQVLRSAETGKLPTPSDRLTGEQFINFPDRQLGVIEGNKAHLLLAIRMFSKGCAYAAGDHVFEPVTRKIYQALSSVVAGDFTRTAWKALDTLQEFNTLTQYNPNDLVSYQGLIYTCLVIHKGAWDPSHFRSTSSGS